MFDSIWNDIKQSFRTGTMVNRIIIANVAVFVTFNLIRVFLFVFGGADAGLELFEKFLRWFQASNTLNHNLFRPWTIFTYMFLHMGFWHIFWNMLIFMWFGRVLGDMIGDKKILPIYLIGGLVGWLVYVIFSQFLPMGSYMLGASAGVMAVVMAAAVVAPDYQFNLIFIGPVKIKYIALTMIFLDLIAIPTMSNTGGHLAHLGGVAAGYGFIELIRRGTDLSIPINNFLDKIVNFFRGAGLNFKRPKGPKVAFRNPRGKAKSDSDTKDANQQERIDAILEKIKRSGYKSLTEEERDILFRASKEK
ncbi:MAG: rhomboid family intramembrane serine protease [Bacteroidota bacterium]